jgi:hypothetical protein
MGGRNAPDGTATAPDGVRLDSSTGPGNGRWLRRAELFREPKSPTQPNLAVQPEPTVRPELGSRTESGATTVHWHRQPSQPSAGSPGRCLTGNHVVLHRW